MNVLCLIILILMLHLKCSGQEIAAGELVINEILFHPPREGFDYVEGYNRSIRTIDLSRMRIASRNAAGELSAPRSLARDPVALDPGRYFVVTANPEWLRGRYDVPDEAAVVQLSQMPSFPNERGAVVFLSAGGEVIDELAYFQDWHFPMIANPQGVALERMNYDHPTQERNNWTSASSSSGHGTPGKRNSQFSDDPPMNGKVMITPAVFSPDNDGSEDFAELRYEMDEPGYMMNAFIYDMAGRKLRHLVKNQLLGLNGVFRWDGTDETLRPIGPGLYLLFTEVFNLRGRSRKFRHSIVLRRAE